MRYGTVLVVRYTGGLRDTVEDISTGGGAGLNFTYPVVDDIVHAMNGTLGIYNHKGAMESLIHASMKFDLPGKNLQRNI